MTGLFQEESLVIDVLNVRFGWETDGRPTPDNAN